VVKGLNQIAQRADGSAIGAEAVATGFVLGEMRAMAQQQQALGHRQVGAASVTSVDVVKRDLKASPPTMVLAVCVDVSDIDVLDSNDRSLKDALYNPGHPVKHLYGAVFTGEVWKVSTHEIPIKQDCTAPTAEEDE